METKYREICLLDDITMSHVKRGSIVKIQTSNTNFEQQGVNEAQTCSHQYTGIMLMHSQ